MPVADIRVALGDFDKCYHIECDLNADILCMNTPQYNTTRLQYNNGNGAQGFFVVGGILVLNRL